MFSLASPHFYPSAGEWLDSLLGGFFASFVVGAASPDGGQPASFLLKCHACELAGLGVGRCCAAGPGEAEGMSLAMHGTRRECRLGVLASPWAHWGGSRCSNGNLALLLAWPAHNACPWLNLLHCPSPPLLPADEYVKAEVREPDAAWQQPRCGCACCPVLPCCVARHAALGRYCPPVLTCPLPSVLLPLRLSTTSRQAAEGWS